MTGKEKCPVLAPTTSQSNQYQRQIKGKDYFESELIRVEKALFEKPQTMKEVDRRIGVMRESICRYCAKLRKQDKLYPIRKRICNVTGHPAIEWSTNPALVPPRPKQLDLFTADGSDPIKVQEPVKYELQLRIVEHECTEYLVFESSAFEGVLKIIPQKTDGFIAESIAWTFLFKGTLCQCDAFVSNLINLRK